MTTRIDQSMIEGLADALAAKLAAAAVSAFALTLLDDPDAATMRTTLGVGDGSGDLVGPAAATDNAAARFDTATGKLLQDSPLLIADTSGALSRAGGGGIAVQGTNTNDSALAGQVGEYIEASRAQGSALGLTTITAANITSISLTAGDWDVSASVNCLLTATTSLTEFWGSISTTTATLDTAPGRHSRMQWPAFVAGGGTIAMAVPTVRLSLASTTTVYLVTRATFTASALSAFGLISARRVR